MSYDEFQQEIQRTQDNLFAEATRQSEEAMRIHEQNVQMDQQMQQDAMTAQQAVMEMNNICRDIFGF